MSNDYRPDHGPDHQRDHHPGGRPGEGPQAHPAPGRDWGGEYDSDTTAFIAFPPGGLPAGGEDPLAAPGHGYQPPDLAADPAVATPPAASDPLPTPGATMDPGATGQWTMPFAHGAADWPAQQRAGSSGGASRAAAMGQGAAAALGGLQQGRRGAAQSAAESAAETATAFPTEPPEAAAPGAPLAEDLVGPAEPTAVTGAAGYPHQAPAAPAGLPEVGLATAGLEAHREVPAADPAVGGAAASESEASTAALTRSEHPEASYVLRVNGVERPVSAAWIGESLLYVLRERLGLAGAKDGCSQGECGACSVQVDGRLVAACLVPAALVAGSEIRTVEGLGADGTPSDVQRALAASTAVQCGFCLPGMAMTVHDLLEGNHAPTELETREALSGNLCRCSGYRGVLDAVREVVAERAPEAEAPPDELSQEQGHEQGATRAHIPQQAGPRSGEVS